MGDQADRVATPFLAMAKIFARAQGDIERVLRIAGRAVGAVVVAIVGRRWEPEKFDDFRHIELLAQAGKVYKARHASILKDRLHRTPLYQIDKKRRPSDREICKLWLNRAIFPHTY